MGKYAGGKISSIVAQTVLGCADAVSILSGKAHSREDCSGPGRVGSPSAAREEWSTCLRLFKIRADGIEFSARGGCDLLKMVCMEDISMPVRLSKVEGSE